MSMISEQIKTLEVLRDELKENGKVISSYVVRDAIRTIEDLSAKVHANNMHGGWIPVQERLPVPDTYILLSFENVPMISIGEYREDEDGSGAFYHADSDMPLVKVGLFVNAWMPLLEPYKEQE